jgi:membrane-bound acyltransferase YfiQ involved in biofilm formation
MPFALVRWYVRALWAPPFVCWAIYFPLGALAARALYGPLVALLNKHLINTQSEKYTPFGCICRKKPGVLF